MDYNSAGEYYDEYVRLEDSKVKREIKLKRYDFPTKNASTDRVQLISDLEIAKEIILSCYSTNAQLANACDVLKEKKVQFRPNSAGMDRIKPRIKHENYITEKDVEASPVEFEGYGTAKNAYEMQRIINHNVRENYDKKKKNYKKQSLLLGAIVTAVLAIIGKIIGAISFGGGATYSYSLDNPFPFGKALLIGIAVVIIIQIVMKSSLKKGPNEWIDKELAKFTAYLNEKKRVELSKNEQIKVRNAQIDVENKIIDSENEKVYNEFLEQNKIIAKEAFDKLKEYYDYLYQCITARQSTFNMLYRDVFSWFPEKYEKHIEVIIELVRNYEATTLAQAIGVIVQENRAAEDEKRQRELQAKFDEFKAEIVNNQNATNAAIEASSRRVNDQMTNLAMTAVDIHFFEKLFNQ